MMKNIESHWERICRTNWPNIYLRELYWLARETSELCESVFEAAPAPKPGPASYITVDHTIHLNIYRALNNAARITALVKDRPKRNQSAGQYAIQKERIHWLLEVLSGVKISELTHAKVRHTLEHFDEYVDETALKSSRGQIDMPTVFSVDMVLGRESTIDLIANVTPNMMGATSYPIRVYCAEERVFLNCGKRVNLGSIAQESADIAAAVLAHSPHVLEDTDVSTSNRGSTMMVIDESHYDGKADFVEADA
ncbi:hypothetical protein OHC50_16165 [Paenarthrobacter ilicis]|uniref:hypothetical protein n=1 Tax=Paenarthrobacter ilicis TaxID=43665 RepID=UPI00300B96B9